MTHIEAHYRSDGIAERILAAIRKIKGENAVITPEVLAPIDHFHNRGVLATQDLLNQLALGPGERLLDIGCGIGGPARWIAWKSGCHVTGVDLTPEFCQAAETLNTATGLGDRVRIVQGSALALPLPDAAFDRAYSQNVAMNIADKRGMYREACRVLKPGGQFVLSSLGAGPKGPPYYPVPWAAGPETSFLATLEETKRDLSDVGFVIEKIEDTTERLLAAHIAMRKKMETDGKPPLSIDILMGERMAAYQDNTFRSLQDGRLSASEAIARKPN